MKVHPNLLEEGIDGYTVLTELHTAYGAAVIDWRRQRSALLREHLPS